jgi:hypothetical protein
MFGPAEGARRLGGSPASPIFELNFKAGRLLFLPTEGCDYAPFELDLLFEKRRIRIIDSEARVEHYVPRPDPQFAGYFNLVSAELWPGLKPAHSSLELAVKAVVAAAADVGNANLALLERAVAVVEVLEKINVAS